MQYEEKLGKITSYVHKWLTLREPPSVRPCSLNFPQRSGCMYAWINMKAVDQQSISLDPRIQCLISSSNAVLIRCKGRSRPSKEEIYGRVDIRKCTQLNITRSMCNAAVPRVIERTRKDATHRTLKSHFVPSPLLPLILRLLS